MKTGSIAAFPLVCVGLLLMASAVARPLHAAPVDAIDPATIRDGSASCRPSLGGLPLA